MKYMELLGHRVRDVVTGFEGIVESISYDLYGCIQVDIRPPMPKDWDGKDFPNGRWFDAKRLKVLSTNPVMAVPVFEWKEQGPADKPTRHDLPSR